MKAGTTKGATSPPHYVPTLTKVVSENLLKTEAESDAVMSEASIQENALEEGLALLMEPALHSSPAAVSTDF